jgi:hypothetical protein
MLSSLSAVASRPGKTTNTNSNGATRYGTTEARIKTLNNTDTSIYGVSVTVH